MYPNFAFTVLVYCLDETDYFGGKRLETCLYIGVECRQIHVRTEPNENTVVQGYFKVKIYKKLSYCWETVRRESMPRIAEMDVEMTT